MGLVILKGLHTGLFDVVGRFKVRFADGEADDIPPGRLQAVDFVQYFKRIFGSQLVQAVCCLHGRAPFSSSK